MYKAWKTKRKVIIRRGLSLVVFTCLAGAMNPAVAGRAGERAERARDRITEGVQSGALTRREVATLRGEQRKIQSVRKRAGRDGHLSRRERLKIERLQDRASKNIAALKHNRRRRR